MRRLRTEIYIGEAGRKISTRIKEHERLCRKMDNERSELADHIARTGHEINWKATERKTRYVDNTRKWKIREAIGMLGEKNLMNRRLEEGRVSDNFAYCLSKLGEKKNRARPAKMRRLDQGSTANRRKRDRSSRDRVVGSGVALRSTFERHFWSRQTGCPSRLWPLMVHHLLNFAPFLFASMRLSLPALPNAYPEGQSRVTFSSGPQLHGPRHQFALTSLYVVQLWLFTFSPNDARLFVEAASFFNHAIVGWRQSRCCSTLGSKLAFFAALLAHYRSRRSPASYEAFNSPLRFPQTPATSTHRHDDQLLLARGWLV
ncbi:unnamed protein product [Protopolystoma xenopodis]|uniref:GIY-YIG domain-containing protein n=1 Tax=Protopolystoma xenopodis TaxID=117903 RepID=A0A448XLD3_9PLAT|nr:unnamed protein product [Protopolystoma xenopodis]